VLSVREAVFPQDRGTVEQLLIDYLTWVDHELDVRYGLRVPVQDTVEEDLAAIGRFQPPDGRIMLAVDGDEGFGIACMRRIGQDTAEIKRMYVASTRRRAGSGRSMLDRLVEQAQIIGYARIRLDSPDFATAAHELYRSSGFRRIEPYPESEIPETHRPHAVFMERQLQ